MLEIVVGTLAVGLIGALVYWRQPALAFSVRTVDYLSAVKAELKKVSWPSSDELRRSTLVIIAFVIVIGIVIGLMDAFFSKLLIDYLGRMFG